MLFGLLHFVDGFQILISWIEVFAVSLRLGWINNLEYYKDKENKKVFRLLVCSNCVSCENKKIVFRTRDANSSINIMKLTSCWIDKQERPLCFQISSFTSSRIKTEEEKIRPSQVKFLLLILHHLIFNERLSHFSFRSV